MANGNAIQNIWTIFQGWANANALQYVADFIPRERTDLKGEDAPLTPMRDYFRLWLSDMFLSKSRKWFVDVYPAVHSSVSLKFGRDIVKISHVTEGSTKPGPGANLDYAVTDLLPFNGGTVEIQSGLVALKGTNYAAQTISILKDFSGLVAAPLGAALTIAEKVSGGMQKVLAGSDIVLALHRQFRADSGDSGGNVLRSGYIAVVLATAQQIDITRLFVKGSRLLYASDPGAEPQPLQGYDYMLFFIESRPDRDNWRMPNIEEPLNQAIQATLEGKVKEAEEFTIAAKVVVWQSPDLAVQDRRRVSDAIDAELQEVAKAAGRLGGAPAKRRSLQEIMTARAKPFDQALNDPPLTLREIIA